MRLTGHVRRIAVRCAGLWQFVLQLLQHQLVVVLLLWGGLGVFTCGDERTYLYLPSLTSLAMQKSCMETRSFMILTHSDWQCAFTLETSFVLNKILRGISETKINTGGGIKGVILNAFPLQLL